MTTRLWVITAVTAVLLGSIAGGLVGSFVVNDRLDEARSAALVDIADQRTVMQSLSEVMARGGADTITEAVIKDCEPAERQRFDALLGKLSATISRAELVELSRLFDRCAYFYARQKAVMAARLTREVDVYKLLIDRLKRLEPTADPATFSETVWDELAKLEREQSRYFNDLVSIQGKIISAMVNGAQATSPELDALRKEAGEAQEMLTFNAIQMNEQRTSLPGSL